MDVPPRHPPASRSETFTGGAATNRPLNAGLYDAAYEHDSCGVGCIARLDARRMHEVVERALEGLDNLEHRGARGADPGTGDGAGILVQLPDELIRAKAAQFGIADAKSIPPAGRIAIAMCFLPLDVSERAALETLVAEKVEGAGQRILGWRDVPVDPTQCGETARERMPFIRQLLVGAGDGPEGTDQDVFERLLFVIRRRIELAAGNRDDFSISSFSSRTLVYKGMLSAPQLRTFYADLTDPELKSALAIVHSRFSTNTFPSWELAHPHRFIAHNGEINTVAGNYHWMRARESVLRSELIGEGLRECLPLIAEGESDSGAFDRVFELLVLAGRSPAHAMMMMVPQAWENRDGLADELRDFYRHHSTMMEPWDGPALLVFSDGRVVGAAMDRNGLRPGRWQVTNDGWVTMGSEAGAFPMPETSISERGRMTPGRLFIVDVERGRVLDNWEAELSVAQSQPYGEWFAERTTALDDLPEGPVSPGEPLEPLRTRQLAFGYTQEDLRVLIAPMAETGKEPTGSMGNDAALAVLSDQQPSLFSYFKQRFAQVTNPAIDPIREQIVMSLETKIGPEGNLLDEPPKSGHLVFAEQPILLNSDLEKLRQVDHPVLKARTLDITWPLADGPEGVDKALDRVCDDADAALAEGATILILSDRNLGPDRVPIPSLLATAALHEHLVRAGNRRQTGLVIESGEPREVHHMACLIGYGAEAINPYLMLESIEGLEGRAALARRVDPDGARSKVIKALGLGLLKVLSKMGVSTIHSYCGAQLFDAVGIDRSLIEKDFSGTPSRIGGIGLEGLAREAIERHARAYPARHGRRLRADIEEKLLPVAHERLLPQGGIYAWRRDGERHMWDPTTIAKLQHSARVANGDGARPYAEFSRYVNEENVTRGLIRGLLELKPSAEPIPIEEVEPAAEIVKRFSTGAMSLGALSKEAHETLAVAMNRLGGRSNSGEGGEDALRYEPEPNGDSRRSAIHQVASGRFGVTAHYLVNADQLQIKISQGSKPGEGGQLPGQKVDPYIASLRFSTPGVELISPPPHHDIYSIEDLKQLIYDLRCSNPSATVSVKLAAEVGVGTVAAGVAKAGADHIVIAGHDGGTGASPLSSIQAAGAPWEIGLAETQQTLINNGLRTRVVLQTDGQMRTGRDAVIAALLGADEVGFSTAPLIAMGCIMMRVCHLNTCPVGVATQDPELRRRFSGKPEHVINYLVMVAEEARALMASLGIARFEDLIGRADLLEPNLALDQWKASGVELGDLLFVPDDAPVEERRHDPGWVRLDDASLDPLELLPDALHAIEEGGPVLIERDVRNVHRAIGGVVSSEIARLHGPEGLPEDTVRIHLCGSAGQSLGAWAAAGVTIDVQGEANDYVGKGLSGGIICVRPPEVANLVAERNVIIGNVALYGATGGRAFFRGRAGERFAIRNSGASAVVEGIGDHGCEYMTGGHVVVLGSTGYNFAAGMSGGIAYVYDPRDRFPVRCNRALVDLESLDEEDVFLVRGLVEEHRLRTGSEFANVLLADWSAAIEAFIKVIPRDYKRALSERHLALTTEAPA